MSLCSSMGREGRGLTCRANVLYVLLTMRFEWDREKNRLNQVKHGGIAFETAAHVFEDA